MRIEDLLRHQVDENPLNEDLINHLDPESLAKLKERFLSRADDFIETRKDSNAKLEEAIARLKSAVSLAGKAGVLSDEFAEDMAKVIGFCVVAIERSEARIYHASEGRLRVATLIENAEKAINNPNTPVAVKDVGASNLGVHRM